MKPKKKDNEQELPKTNTRDNQLFTITHAIRLKLRKIVKDEIRYGNNSEIRKQRIRH